MKETPALLPKGEDSFSLFFNLAFSLSPSFSPPPRLPSIFLSFDPPRRFSRRRARVRCGLFSAWQRLGQNVQQPSNDGCSRSCLEGAKQKNTVQVEQVLQRVAFAAPSSSWGHGFALTVSHTHMGPSWVRGHSIYKVLSVYTAIKTDPQPGKQKQTGGGEHAEISPRIQRPKKHINVKPIFCSNTEGKTQKHGF